ncbi:hypothetical protein GCM10022405_12640 [Gibbsiella dentisursi]|uniref:Uncharacterized protein n=1 Tax=Gibbsiella dentisursi TaxID=796890 RepID=A0ABP7KXY1_9GAMM
MILTEPFITGVKTCCASARCGNISPKCRILAIKPSGDKIAKLMRIIRELAMTIGKDKINASRIADTWICEFNFIAMGTRIFSMPRSKAPIKLMINPYIQSLNIIYSGNVHRLIAPAIRPFIAT